MIRLIKFKYKKSSKSIKLKEIADSMRDFSDKISAYASNSSSLTTKLLYSFLRPGLIKKCADESMKQFQLKKIDKQTCARYLHDGFPEGNVRRGGLSDLQMMPGRFLLILNQIKELVDAKDQKKMDQKKVQQNLKYRFEEIEKYVGLKFTNKDKNRIKKNIELMVKKTKEFVKNWDSNTGNLAVAMHDLSYVENNKPKDTKNENLKEAEKIITAVAKNIEELCKEVNKYLPKKTDHIKVKDHRQYTNKLKLTVGHAGNVLGLVEKKDEKTRKQLEILPEKIGNKQFIKFKTSRAYKNFQLNPKYLKKARNLLKSK